MLTTYHVPDDGDQGRLGAGSGGSEKGNQNKHLSENSVYCWIDIPRYQYFRAAVISKLNLTGLPAGFGASLVTDWKVRKEKGMLVGQSLPAGGWNPKHFHRYPKAEAVNLRAKNHCFMGKISMLRFHVLCKFLLM